MGQAVEMITDQDLKRILSCLRSAVLEVEILDLWEEKIEQAEIIDQNETPPDLVTIHSVVTCTDDGEGHSELEKMGQLTVVFPNEANIDEGKISLLAPLGVALLGARAGQAITWQARNGRLKSLVVDSIAYQPEANGHWHL